MASSDSNNHATSGEHLTKQMPDISANHKTVLPQALTSLNPPTNAFYLDQMKNGSLVTKSEISKNRLIFGRARDCDITMEHPSISRYHAALLWSPKDDKTFQEGSNMKSFWYLIDCGSTHGTFCNKTKIEAGKMIKISSNNNVIKFGASTRFFVLGSNIEDQIEENDSKTASDGILDDSLQNGDPNACTWGMQMTDCDDEDEESGDSLALKSIIAAMKSDQHSLHSPNENVFSGNPYKCLQQWFEREGYDFETKVDSVHNKFKCTIEIPIDNQWIPIVGQQMNKKKEAIVDTCLKCCNLLDQALLLFPWQKQNARSKAQEEYYDDEDDLLDESVQNTKRFKRENAVYNFETLNVKWKEINEELRQLKVKLATLEPEMKPEIVDNELTDSIDAYLATMNKNKYGLTLNQKIEKSNLKIKIKQLEQEQTKVEKLIQLAKPSTILVDMKNPTPSDDSKKQTPMVEQKNQLVSSTVGEVSLQTEGNLPTSIKNCSEKSISNDILKSQLNPVQTVNDIETTVTKSKTNSAKIKKVSKLKQDSIVQAIEQEKLLEERKNKLVTRHENEADFIDWLPPSGQTGDGKTHLNDKFGY